MSRKLDLVGRGDIAAEHNVTSVSVWRWARRPDFPEPVAMVSNRRVWLRADVTVWAKKNLPLPLGRPRRARAH